MPATLSLPAGSGHNAADRWKKISLMGLLPLIVLLTVFVFSTREEEERPEFKKWPHLYIRTKPYFFGGGPTNRSAFHNKHWNALPDGYEDEIDMDA
ncbi:hypothetical protein KR222_010252, partial [Zaprionus bogoriensis]